MIIFKQQLSVKCPVLSDLSIGVTFCSCTLCAFRDYKLFNFCAVAASQFYVFVCHVFTSSGCYNCFRFGNLICKKNSIFLAIRQSETSGNFLYFTCFKLAFIIEFLIQSLTCQS
nr:MAG TPA: hypothetical protein [Caudoviricetes sp.]